MNKNIHNLYKCISATCFAFLCLNYTYGSNHHKLDIPRASNNSQYNSELNDNHTEMPTHKFRTGEDVTKFIKDLQNAPKQNIGTIEFETFDALQSFAANIAYLRHTKIDVVRISFTVDILSTRILPCLCAMFKSDNIVTIEIKNAVVILNRLNLIDYQTDKFEEPAYHQINASYCQQAISILNPEYKKIKIAESVNYNCFWNAINKATLYIFKKIKDKLHIKHTTLLIEPDPKSEDSCDFVQKCSDILKLSEPQSNEYSIINVFEEIGNKSSYNQREAATLALDLINIIIGQNDNISIAIQRSNTLCSHDNKVCSKFLTNDQYLKQYKKDIQNIWTYITNNQYYKQFYQNDNSSRNYNIIFSGWIDARESSDNNQFDVHPSYINTNQGHMKDGGLSLLCNNNALNDTKIFTNVNDHTVRVKDNIERIIFYIENDKLKLSSDKNDELNLSSDIFTDKIDTLVFNGKEIDCSNVSEKDINELITVFKNIKTLEAPYLTKYYGASVFSNLETVNVLTDFNPNSSLTREYLDLRSFHYLFERNRKSIKNFFTPFDDGAMYLIRTITHYGLVERKLDNLIISCKAIDFSNAMEIKYPGVYPTNCIIDLLQLPIKNVYIYLEDNEITNIKNDKHMRDSFESFKNKAEDKAKDKVKAKCENIKYINSEGLKKLKNNLSNPQLKEQDLVKI